MRCDTGLFAELKRGFKKYMRAEKKTGHELGKWEIEIKTKR